MKRRHIFTICVFLNLQAFAQTNGIDAVLRLIEHNNIELQAAAGQSAIDALDSRIENNLPDPSVSYSHQYGNRKGLGYQGEFIASQTFEFPTIYAKRGKLAAIKAEETAARYNSQRRDIMLRAKVICLDLILLNQQKRLLSQRLDNTMKLSDIYTMRLQKGDANVLETNKVGLELLNIKSEVRKNEADRQSKLSELVALNGGKPVIFTDTVYPPEADLPPLAELKDEVMESDADILALRNKQEYLEGQIDVRRSQGLPDFEIGYRLNTSSGNERFNGFLVGINIPIFANRGQVKKARIQRLQSQLQLDNSTITIENQLEEMYSRAELLKRSIDEYSTVLSEQDDISLLNKALEAGQISMIEYFVNITTLYQSLDNYLQLQNEYRKMLAVMYKFRL